MRLGVLDVGSNSVKLQVVDGRPGAPPLKTSAFKDAVRLAECTDGDGAISDAGSARLVDATKRAVAVADEQGVTELIGFATAAIRDARNGPALCALLDRAAGVPLRALTGDDEARFTFLAARRWFGWSAGPLLVLDIGGGSLEVACGRDEEPEVAVSLPLGAGRLTLAYLAGAVVAYEAMRAFDVGKIQICPWALREGILLRRLDGMHDPVEEHEADIIATATIDPQR